MQHQLPRLFIVLKCKWLLQSSVKHWRGGPLPRLSTARWGKLGWLLSSLSNNRPFILGERNESATPGPFQQPRRLPAGQPISNSQLVWGPQIDLNKSRHLSLQKLEGHTCLCGKWSCFTFCGIVPFQRTSSIFLTTWLPFICQMKNDVKLWKSSAKGNEPKLSERCFVAVQSTSVSLSSKQNRMLLSGKDSNYFD